MSVAALDTHPVPACVQTLEAALDSLSPEMWDGLEATEIRRLVARLARVESRLVAQKMAATRVLDRTGAARSAGASSTGELIARDFGGDRRSGDALVQSARRIQRETTRTEQALGRGRVSPRQADVIASSMATLKGATAEQRDLAERTLLKDAEHLSLKDLTTRGRRISDVYAPEPEVDATENDLLEARERAARARTELRMWDNGDGTHSGRFTLPDLEATMLKTALDALAAPHQSLGVADRHGNHAEVGFGDDYPQRLGLAFAALVGLLPTDGLPNNGGVNATITVDLDLDTLMGGLKAAGLSDGTRISAAQARKLACTAKILPFVMGGDSLPLDLGTARRFFNRHSRLALEKRDGGCTAPGMGVPPHKAHSGGGGSRREVVRSPSPDSLLTVGRDRHPRRSTALLLPSSPRPRPALARTDLAGRRTRRVETAREPDVAAQHPLPPLTPRSTSPMAALTTTSGAVVQADSHDGR